MRVVPSDEGGQSNQSVVVSPPHCSVIDGVAALRRRSSVGPSHMSLIEYGVSQILDRRINVVRVSEARNGRGHSIHFTVPQVDEDRLVVHSCRRVIGKRHLDVILDVCICFELRVVLLNL